MLEEYLQLIWAAKRVPNFGVSTVLGESIEICSFGVWNKLKAGPDFSMGKVRFGNELLIGPIEIHVRSSDWYRHGHHLDENYNNVILHVVHDYDRPVIQNGRNLPTLELKSFIDPVHFRNYRQHRYSTINLICNRRIGEVHVNVIHEMKEIAIFKKWEAKLNRVEQSTCDDQTLLYRLSAMSFGLKLNQDGFLDLAKKVRVHDTINLDLDQMRNLYLVESGILTDEGVRLWNYRGVHFNGSPIKRLQQWARFVHCLHLNSWRLLSLDIEHFNGIDELKGLRLGLSDFMLQQIMLNAILPFYYRGYMITQNAESLQNIRAALKSIKSERYRSLNKWKEAGVSVETAYDSQGLLAIERYYCNHKKCLTCGVGRHLLGK